MSGSEQAAALDVLTAFLLKQPVAAAQLMAEHVDDGRGNCRTCTIGGQRGNHIWPCTLHAAASAAQAQRRP